MARYRDALGYAAEHVLGTNTLTRLGQQVEALWPGLTTEPAYPTLRSHLALRALHGDDPLHLLADAAANGGLATAHDRAAVLDWRLHTGEAVGPVPWLPAIPPALAEHPEWGTYLEARAHRVTGLLPPATEGTTTPRRTPTRYTARNSPACLRDANTPAPGSRRTKQMTTKP